MITCNNCLKEMDATEWAMHRCDSIQTLPTGGKQARHAEICSELNDLYRRKNADYGDSFGKSWDEEGYHAFTVRGGDKMNRIKQLFKNEAQVSDESIIDSLRDLANYCIMTVMELEARK